jgi:putative transposase
VMGVDRSSMRYRGRRAGDAAVRLRIRELAAQRRRFGYRRLHLLLTREGCRMNQKRFRRKNQPVPCWSSSKTQPARTGLM